MTPGPVDPARHTFRSPKFASVVQEAVQFLSTTPVYPFTALPSFPGVGVYALYYFGNFALYDYLAILNQKEYVQPIYVGKAVPRGWRKARTSPSEANRVLFGRLVEHARSIEDVSNLESKDFCCRFMILNDDESDLIAVVEAALIRQYRPLWNTVVDGFGNHDPGSGRYNQARSEWDVLHPGRSWAENLTGTSPSHQSVVAKIQQVKSRLPLP
jgi:hypothetical protein